VDRHIALISAGSWLGIRLTGKLKTATGARAKAVKPTAKRSAAAECTGLKKPWMINLQHRCLLALY